MESLWKIYLEEDMIIVLFIIWILILIGLLSCIYRCKYINTDISNSIGKLLKTSVVTVCGYVLFLNAYNKNAVDYLVAKKRKFKQIAKLNKHNYKQ